MILWRNSLGFFGNNQTSRKLVEIVTLDLRLDPTSTFYLQEGLSLVSTHHAILDRLEDRCLSPGDRDGQALLADNRGLHWMCNGFSLLVVGSQPRIGVWDKLIVLRVVFILVLLSGQLDTITGWH